MSQDGAQSSQYKLAPGPHAVAVHDRLWHDTARRRDVPVRIYSPAAVGAHAVRHPLILFSPGIAAGPDEYAYLGRHWASHGYVSAHGTHPGTDAELLRDVERPWPVIEAALHAPQHRIDRPADLVFAWTSLARDPQLGALIDSDRVAVAGHSFGAFTALALVGLTFDMPGRGDTCVAPADGDAAGGAKVSSGGPSVAPSLRRSVAAAGSSRIRAALVMSPQGVGIFGLHAHSWDRIAVPVLSLTGTRDKGLLSKRVEERIETFARVPAGEQYLAVIHGASHFAFGEGPGLGALRPPRVPEHHDYVRQVSVAFLDGYLGAGIEESRDQGIEERRATELQATKRRSDEATEGTARRWLTSNAPARMSDGRCFVRWRGVALDSAPPDGPLQTPDWLTASLSDGR